MRRREFIAGAVGTAAWSLAARAQQQPALPVVGMVGSASFYDVAAFRKGLSEAGYVEGRNVTVEYHYLEGQLYDPHLPALMADLVRRRVAVIVTFGFPSLAAKDATATIPIVFFMPTDPVKTG
jgi:putative ABC transport system substrate-binding protein